MGEREGKRGRGNREGKIEAYVHTFVCMWVCLITVSCGYEHKGDRNTRGREQLCLGAVGVDGKHCSQRAYLCRPGGGGGRGRGIGGGVEE
jgi:hypothetical protein